MAAKETGGSPWPTRGFTTEYGSIKDGFTSSGVTIDEPFGSDDAAETGEKEQGE